MFSRICVCLNCICFCTCCFCIGEGQRKADTLCLPPPFSILFFFVAVVKIFFHTIYSAHVFPSHSSSQIHFICWDRFSHSTWNSKVQLDRMSSRSPMFLPPWAKIVLTETHSTSYSDRRDPNTGSEQLQQALEPTESSLWSQSLLIDCNARIQVLFFSKTRIDVGFPSVYAVNLFYCHC